MQCPITGFDCIGCEYKCLLEERERHGDPFRRGNNMSTCDDEIRVLELDEEDPADVSDRAYFAEGHEG